MNAINQHIQLACIWEATARKLGNVHRYYDFHKTSYVDFLTSAIVIGDCFDENIGESVFRAVEQTQNAVGQNTNLGISLLLAPLVAAKRTTPECVETVLSKLSVEDSQHVYRAIRLANPGGLGQVEQEDVRSEPTINLREAMRLAVKHDWIAAQYVNGYQEIFQLGLPIFKMAFEFWGNIEAAIIETQITWLALYPDSLIARKNGLDKAMEISKIAMEIVEAGNIRTDVGRGKAQDLNQKLRTPDNKLKFTAASKAQFAVNKLNPGTTADIMAAILFIALQDCIVTTRSNFPWQLGNEEWS
jgi:triphosphoribosyl-dephospho-CoA synthase